MATTIDDLDTAAREAEAEFNLAQQKSDETNLMLETAIQDRADFLTLYADKFSRTFMDEWAGSREPRVLRKK